METNWLIEFVQGEEQHSSNWSKFYVRGLKEWQVREDYKENCNTSHIKYQGYACRNVPSETIFTIFEQSGNKKGVEIFNFYICEVNHYFKTAKYATYGSGWLCGHYKCLASNENSIIKGQRLMEWWLDTKNPTKEHALLYQEFLHQKGVKDRPLLKLYQETVIKVLN